MSPTSGILGALSQIFAAEKNKAHRELLERELKTAQEKIDALGAENEALKERLKDFESEVADSQVGDRCPICRKPQLFVVSEAEDDVFGPVGGYKQQQECAGCGHKTSRLI